MSPDSGRSETSGHRDIQHWWPCLPHQVGLDFLGSSNARATWDSSGQRGEGEHSSRKNCGPGPAWEEGKLGVKAQAAASGEPGVMGTGCFSGMNTGQVNRWQQPWRLQGGRPKSLLAGHLLTAAFPHRST